MRTLLKLWQSINPFERLRMDRLTAFVWLLTGAVLGLFVGAHLANEFVWSPNLFAEGVGLLVGIVVLEIVVRRERSRTQREAFRRRKRRIRRRRAARDQIRMTIVRQSMAEPLGAINLLLMFALWPFNDKAPHTTDITKRIRTQTKGLKALVRILSNSMDRVVRYCDESTFRQFSDLREAIRGMLQCGWMRNAVFAEDQMPGWEFRYRILIHCTKAADAMGWITDRYFPDKPPQIEELRDFVKRLRTQWDFETLERKWQEAAAAEAADYSEHPGPC